MTQVQRLSDQQSLDLFTASGFVPVDDISESIAYPGGIARVNGIDQIAARVYYPMSSNELTQHTTIEWRHPIDNTRRITCNCKGWTLKRRGGVRHCWHTDAMAADPGLGQAPGSLNQTLTPAQLAVHNDRLQSASVQLDRQHPVQVDQDNPQTTPPRRRRRRQVPPPVVQPPDENLRHLDLG